MGCPENAQSLRIGPLPHPSKKKRNDGQNGFNEFNTNRYDINLTRIDNLVKQFARQVPKNPKKRVVTRWPPCFSHGGQRKIGQTADLFRGLPLDVGQTPPGSPGLVVCRLLVAINLLHRPGRAGWGPSKCASDNGDWRSELFLNSSIRVGGCRCNSLLQSLHTARAGLSRPRRREPPKTSVKKAVSSQRDSRVLQKQEPGH